MSITDNIPPLDWPALRQGLEELAGTELSEGNVSAWLDRWTQLSGEAGEYSELCKLATMLDSKDTLAAARYRDFLDSVTPQLSKLEQALRMKLLDSGIEPEGMETPLRRMRNRAAIHREENLPLSSRLAEMGMQYSALCGNWTFEMDGQRQPVAVTRRLMEDRERSVREHGWRSQQQCISQDRERLSAIWREMLELRCQLAENAGLGSFTEYAWLEQGRHDYSPADMRTFHSSVLSVVTPALSRRHELRASEMGVDSLRPWDLTCDSPGREPLRPFSSSDELVEGVVRAFTAMDPRLGKWVHQMADSGCLDLGNRRGKSPGGYMTVLPGSLRPLIMMNAVGMAIDVRILVHECGHAFHALCSSGLPWQQQRELTMETSELAAIAMELLAMPYLAGGQGGFFSREELAREQRSQLEYIISSWAMYATVDSLEHWIYANRDEAPDAGSVSEKYLEIYRSYHPQLDLSGIEEEVAWSWQRIQHIYRHPFYYIDYGLAQLGAIQLWANAQRDSGAALQQYLDFLALGGTADIPQLFETAGASFAFDEESFRGYVDSVETGPGSQGSL